MKKLFFISCMVLVSFSFAKKWDAVYISKLISGGGTDKVIEYYKTRYYGKDRDPQDAFRIAELYVKKKDYPAAMEWYDKESQLISTSKINLFNYANTNRLMGEYQKALDGYLMYAALTGDVNKVMDLANQCEKILKSSALSFNYKLENYPYNTAADESYIAILRTNPVYITVTNTDNKEEQPSSEIYQAVRLYDNFAEPIKAYNKKIPKLIITGLSFSQDGNSVVFSAREEKAGSKKAKNKNERIYTAENLGGNFLNVKPWPFNTDGFSCKNPSFNTDGSAIYFSSNQPGGKGGYDIWESVWIKDKWTTPKNLGKLLNSVADEINPFLIQDEKNATLYFSSDREGGFGGFDIYSAKKSGNLWQDVEMQTAPINSSGDDVSIIYDTKVRTGYFASNRTGGKGGFDMYRFLPFNLKLIVSAKDTFSEKVLDYTLVQVYEGQEKLFEGMTDLNGMASFQVNKDKTYTVKLSKDGYRPFIQKVSSAGMMSGDSVTAAILLKPDAQFSISKGATNNLSLDNYITFTGKVTDAATNKPASKVKMRMVNNTTQKLREVDIDNDGKFELKLLLNNNYKIIFENLENKITDELTTLGLEKNSVKVRDYLLSGNKFKLTENKVFKNGNLPKDREIKPDYKKSIQGNTTAGFHEPITQQKIDSLKRVLSNDGTLPDRMNKPVPLKKDEANTDNKVIAEAVKQNMVKEEQKKHTVLMNQTLYSISKLYNVGVDDLRKWNNLPGNSLKTGATLIVSEPGNNQIVSQIIAEDNSNESDVKKAEIPPAVESVKMEDAKISKQQTIVLAEKAPEVSNVLKKDTIVVSSVNEEDKFSLAADMIDTKQSKKVKVAKSEKKASAENNLPEKKTAQAEEIKDTEIVPQQQPVKIQSSKTENPVKSIESDTKPETAPSQEIKPETPEIAKPEQNQILKEALPEVYFKIQLASYDQGNISFPEFDVLGKVEEVKAYERYIYRLGNFDSLQRAKEVLEMVRAQGYFVAFILQYNKDKVTGIIN